MHTIYKQQPLLGGLQKLYRFDNGYGASVIQHSGSYGYDSGLWELAVVTWNADKYNLNYDTDITNDVIGHLTLDDVEEILARIDKL